MWSHSITLGFSCISSSGGWWWYLDWLFFFCTDLICPNSCFQIRDFFPPLRSSISCIYWFVIHLFVVPSSIISRSSLCCLIFSQVALDDKSHSVTIVTLNTRQVLRENTKYNWNFGLFISIPYVLSKILHCVLHSSPHNSCDNELHTKKEIPWLTVFNKCFILLLL